MLRLAAEGSRSIDSDPTLPRLEIPVLKSCALTFCVLLTGCAFAASAQCPAPANPGPAKRINVSHEVLALGLQKETLPSYPDAALQQKVHWAIVLSVLVDETGHMLEAKALSGEPVLAQAALDAVCGYQFRPYLINGLQVAVGSQMIFDFTIKGHGAKATGHVKYEK
jgi:outer membrane biosynthesis protein TonB